jgi:hypothetical protein
VISLEPMEANPQDLQKSQLSPEKPAETPQNKSRRDFIRNAGLASLTAGAATLAGRDKLGEPASAAPPNLADDSRRMQGGAPIVDQPFKRPDGSTETILPPLKERVMALKQLLIEKKLISDQAVQGFVDYYEKFVGPHLGAAVVAHAWTNPDWKAQLLAPPAAKPFQAALLTYIPQVGNPAEIFYQ